MIIPISSPAYHTSGAFIAENFAISSRYTRTQFPDEGAACHIFLVEAVHTGLLQIHRVSNDRAFDGAGVNVQQTLEE
jgi:hypothetical protein